LSIIKKDKKFQKNSAKINVFSSLVEKQIAKIHKSDEGKVAKLTFEELQDFDRILQIANYLLCKYEDKKEIHSLLKDFVCMVCSSSNSLDTLNDQIDELMISANGAVNRIKAIQTRVSENFTVDSAQKELELSEISRENSRINLTKSITPVYTPEYQGKSTAETEQVI